MSFCRYIPGKPKAKHGLRPGDGAFVRLMGTVHNFGYYECGGEIADWLHLSPDAMEEIGLEPGDRVAWFHDEKRRLVGLRKDDGPVSYTVACYGCHGSGRVNAPILTALEAPGDREPRDLVFDQEAGMYCFSIAPKEP